MKPNNQVLINNAHMNENTPSTAFEDISTKVSNLTTYLREGARDAALLAENAISLLEKRGFKRLSDKEAELVRNSLIRKDSRYMGIFVKEGLFAEVYKDCHWLMNQIPNTTHSFAKINFRNKEGTYISSNCFCGLN